MNISLTADDVVAAASVITPIAGAIVAYVGWVNNRVSKSWEAIDMMREAQAKVWTRDDHEHYRLEVAADRKALALEIKEDFKDLSAEIKELRLHFDETVRRLTEK